MSKFPDSLGWLEKHLAFDGAKRTIETFCKAEIAPFGTLVFFDTSSADVPAEQMAVSRALVYLTARDLIVRHPEHPSWVRFKTPEA